MKFAELRAWITSHDEQLRKLGVRSLSVFGSVARNEAGPTSDVDLLVEFEGPTTFDRLMDLEEYLVDALPCKVDLATPRALKPSVRESILSEAIRVA